MLSLHDVLLAALKSWPDDLFVTDDRGGFDFKTVISDVQRMSNKLIEEGVSVGDRVLVMTKRDCDQVTLLLAIVNISAIYVPLGASASDDTVFHIAKNSGAKFLITDRKDIKFNHRDLSLQIIFKNDLKVGRNQSAEKFKNGSSNAPAAILYTSGSTGTPKGVVQTVGNLLEGAVMVNKIQKINRGDIVGSLLPFNFDYGVNYIFICLISGATLSIHNFLNATLAWDFCEKNKVTVLPLMPAILDKFLSTKALLENKIQSVRLVCSSGGHFRSAFIEFCKNSLPNADIMPMYGFSEAFRSTFASMETVQCKPKSVGKGFPGVKIIVVDENFQECSANEEGLILHIGGCLSLGYWENDVATAERFTCVYIDGQSEKSAISGDYGYKDKAGDLFIVGRRDNQLKRSGMRVNLEQIENHFAKLFKNQSICVVRLDENVEGKIVLVFENQFPHETKKELRRFIRLNSPSEFIPDAIAEFEEFPLLQNLGKIDRVSLQTFFVGSKEKLNYII